MRFVTVFAFLLVYLTSVETALCKEVPTFWLRNLEGKRFDSRKQEQPYVLSFFFVNCVPCIKEIPQLYQMMKAEFPDTPLLFIDPLKEDSKKEIKRFAKRLKVPLSYFYMDRFSSVSKKFFDGKMTFPTIIGVRDGNYLFRHNGLNEQILDEIRRLL